ncbi:MAG: acylphosphatase [Bacteroidota bacterium]
MVLRNYRIIVKGKVQGVGYRFNAQARAHQFNLTGFVKNLHDESVLIQAEGEEEKVNQFIEWCYVGPRWAEVTEVHAEETALAGYQTFEIKR